MWPAYMFSMIGRIEANASHVLPTSAVTIVSNLLLASNDSFKHLFKNLVWHSIISSKDFTLDNSPVNANQFSSTTS